MTEPKTGRPSPGYVDNIITSYHDWGLPLPRLQTALNDFA
jgi:hypothetical protein